MAAASYVDPLTGELYPLTAPRWRSAHGTPLIVTPGRGISRDDVDRRVRSLWRYRAALPVEIVDPISMGEGATPLIERAWGELRPHFKLEWFNPTGSFKDRGASVMLSFLRQIGVESVLEDSSGNGGAAIAGFGAAGGLKVKILAPSATSEAKIAQARAYGAEVELVEGPRENAETEAIRQSERIFYASHNWQPFFLEGVKTLAYELWEDFGFAAPDNVIMPVGAGSSLLGCAFGFRELRAAGAIARLPRLFAAQPLNCSPIAASFDAGVDISVSRETRPTIAEGTAIRRPRRLREILGALRESGGGCVAVTEGEILAALGRLVRTGLLVEPTSAVAAAALDKLAAAGAIGPGESTVVLLTGTGLKAALAVAEATGGDAP